MDYIDVIIKPSEATRILNAADKEGRSYRFVRQGGPNLPRASGGDQLTTRLSLESDDWVGPTPTITLLPDGTWTCTLDVYFG